MKTKKTYQPPFKRYFDKGIFVIEMEMSLDDGAWGAYFGGIQKALRVNTWKSVTFNTVLFDFSKCQWADPSPLLSLIISLAQFKDSNQNNKILIKLPAPQENNYKRFLRFLSQEGFLKLFFNYAGKVSIGNSEVKESEIESFKLLYAELCYVNSKFIPAELLCLKEVQFIKKWVDEKIAIAESIITDKAPAWSQDDLIYRMKVFLRETIHNIFIHAYPDSDVSYAGIYVRYRQGLLAGLNIEQQPILQSALTRENKSEICPVLPMNFLKTRQGCLEIFIIDSGVGICNSIHETDPWDLSIRRRRFQKVWNDVFQQGLRKTSNRTILTRYGGLHLLGQLF